MIDNKIVTTPPLSPYLLLGLAARPLFSKPLLDPIISFVARSIQKRHPRIVKRLSKFAPVDIVIVPTDLPLSFLMSFREDVIHLSIIDDEFVNDRIKTGENVAIKGSIDVLLQMVEGKTDGDALFFSRQLTIEGCTEIVVALRNILEAENIDLESEFASLFGPLKKPAGLLGRIAANVHQSMIKRFSSDIELIKKTCVNEVEKKCAYQDKKQKKMAQKISELESKLIDSENKIRTLRKKVKD